MCAVVYTLDLSPLLLLRLASATQTNDSLCSLARTVVFYQHFQVEIFNTVTFITTNSLTSHQIPYFIPKNISEEMSSADQDTSLLLNAVPLLYDDGTPIPPEAEGSVRMALGLTEEVLLRFAGDADDEQPKTRGAGEDNKQAAHGAEGDEGEDSGLPFIAELVPYAEADPLLAEEQRLKALAWLHIHSTSSSSSSGAVPPTLASPQQSAEACANNKGKKADVMEAAEKITTAGGGR